MSVSGAYGLHMGYTMASSVLSGPYDRTKRRVNPGRSSGPKVPLCSRPFGFPLVAPWQDGRGGLYESG